MTRVLTIVGASVRAAAQSAVRAGFRVYAGDRFADADLCSICEAMEVGNYPVGLADVVCGSQAGPWMYTGALENHSRIVALLARLRPLWGNSAAVLRRVRNPHQVAEALARCGLRAPAVVFDAERVPRNGTWVAKSRRSAGGVRVSFWDDAAPRVARSAGGYLQQFIDGRSYSAVYLAAGGRAILLGITRQLIGEKWCGTSGFRYCGSVGPLNLPPAATDEFARLGDVLAGHFNLVGLFGVDAVVNGAGVWAVEVNPRYTASVEILERAGGESAVALHAAACEEGKLPQFVEQRADRVFGKAILYAPTRLIAAPEWAVRAPAGQAGEWPLLADVPRTGSVIAAGGPILTVFADGENEVTVLNRLRDRARNELNTVARQCAVGDSA